MLTELERMLEFRRLDGRTRDLDPEPLPSPIVRLTVTDHTVPSEAPSDLAESIVRTFDGDWTFRRLSIRRLESYLEWRSSWESSHTLGSIRMLRELPEALRRHDVDVPDTVAASLQQLVMAEGSFDGCSLDLVELTALHGTVRSFADRVRTSGATGVGLVETSPTVHRTGLLRSWTGAGQRLELARRGTATVRFVSGRLSVLYADDRTPIIDVRSFELGIDGAVVVDACGNEHLLDTEATDAMCAVAPEATAWRVRRVPEILVWAELLAGLQSACDAVRASGRRARVHLGDERHTALAAAL